MSVITRKSSFKFSKGNCKSSRSLTNDHYSKMTFEQLCCVTAVLDVFYITETESFQCTGLKM